MDGTSRTKLIRRFQDSSASVLLGTSSFWEGVDIPGEALTCLAIVRLPFQPPNHPLVEAKSELLQQQKKNPFMKLSVPQAVIRFKQGFGRLVRTAQDKGLSSSTILGSLNPITGSISYIPCLDRRWSTCRQRDRSPNFGMAAGRGRHREPS